MPAMAAAPAQVVSSPERRQLAELQAQLQQVAAEKAALEEAASRHAQELEAASRPAQQLSLPQPTSAAGDATGGQALSTALVVCREPATEANGGLATFAAARRGTSSRRRVSRASGGKGTGKGSSMKRKPVSKPSVRGADVTQSEWENDPSLGVHSLNKDDLQLRVVIINGSRVRNPFTSNPSMGDMFKPMLIRYVIWMAGRLQEERADGEYSPNDCELHFDSEVSAAQEAADLSAAVEAGRKTDAAAASSRRPTRRAAAAATKKAAAAAAARADELAAAARATELATRRVRDQAKSQALRDHEDDEDEDDEDEDDDYDYDDDDDDAGVEVLQAPPAPPPKKRSQSFQFSQAATDGMLRATRGGGKSARAAKSAAIASQKRDEANKKRAAEAQRREKARARAKSKRATSPHKRLARPQLLGPPVPPPSPHAGLTAALEDHSEGSHFRVTEESEEDDEDPDVQAEQLAAREALLKEWAKKDWTVESIEGREWREIEFYWRCRFKGFDCSFDEWLPFRSFAADAQGVVPMIKKYEVADATAQRTNDAFMDVFNASLTAVVKSLARAMRDAAGSVHAANTKMHMKCVKKGGPPGKHTYKCVDSNGSFAGSARKARQNTPQFPISRHFLGT